jgi:Tfp pilus assembly protein PilX
MKKPHHITSLQTRSIHQDQKGMVAIMVTLILMIVISLLVLGFAQISRRNQRTTLDRQLSTQAFYAAESGINDARQLINQQIVNGNAVTSKTTCATATNGMYVNLPTNVLDAASDVSYTCLLVNALPTSLRYDKIEDQSTIIPLISGNGNIASITMAWKTGDQGSTTPINNCPNGPGVTQEFTATTGWNCGYGVFRFDLVPVAGNGLTSANLQTATMTTFAIPAKNGTNSINFGANINASVAVKCDNTNCTLKVANLNTDQYYMRVRTIYKGAPLEITGQTASGQEVQFSNAQVVVDATGKAQDVLRRLQVRVPVSEVGSQNQMPDNALESNDSICKRFSVMDNYYTSAVPGTISGANILCQP